MKNLVQQLFNTCLSFITTLLIMAAPIAALVYASEPTAAVDSLSLNEPNPAAYSEPVKDNSAGAVVIYQVDDEHLFNFSTK